MTTTAPAREGTVVRRRRALGTASARSLLMTVLGEFALPGGAPVWTSAFVTLLGELGVEEKNTRQALMRLAADGWIRAERHGRRARWVLTPAGERLLADGTQRIYSFHAGSRQWDGDWLLVRVELPEGQRAVRQRLRTRFAWAGLGELPGGLWISPRPDREAEVRRVLTELGLVTQSMSFLATTGSVGSVEEMVRQAWDLDAIGARYSEFLRVVTPLQPIGARQSLVHQVRLVQEWRRFPYMDPGLPRQFLPRDWAGTVAAELFRTRHDDWADLAWAAWRALLAE